MASPPEIRLAGGSAGLRGDGYDADRRVPLADGIGPGKVVLTGLVFDTVGMGMLVVIDDQTSYGYIITSFVIMAGHGSDDDAGVHRSPWPA